MRRPLPVDRGGRLAPRSLALALEGLTTELVPASTLARVQQLWEPVVGPAVASAATPTAEHDGVLTIACSASVWAQELDLMATELLTRLNTALGTELLHKLRCRVSW